MPRRTVPLAIVFVALGLALVGVAGAATTRHDSTPIGPLPPGPVTAISTPKGSLVAVALPRQKASTGLVWRVARPVDDRVVVQISERNVGSSVVLVYRAVGAGNAAVRFGLTRGDTSGVAVRSATYRVHVRTK